MSRSYRFVAYLDLKYSKENIHSILENGLKIGCTYKDYQHNIVNTNRAMEILWKLYSKQSPPLIRAKFCKTHFYLWFYNRNNKIYLRIWPTHIGWKKRYDLCGSYGINFYRYQSFILRLIDNNIITHFETFEYFNETFDIEDMQGNKKIYVKLYTYWPFDVYHHLKVNGKMLGVTWLDTNKQLIDLKAKDNPLENLLNDEQNEKSWYGQHNNIVLKFSLIAGPIFIIEPIGHDGSTTINQAELLDSGLRTTIELFRNLHVFRLITFKSEEDLININKMDD